MRTLALLVGPLCLAALVAGICLAADPKDSDPPLFRAGAFATLMLSSLFGKS